LEHRLTSENLKPFAFDVRTPKAEKAQQRPAMSNLEKQIQTQCELVKRLTNEVHQVVVGQERMINRLLIGLFADGHILLEGLPGLAKSLTVNTLAKTLSLSFNRIQFTPDLLPADIIGTLIYNPREAGFEVKQGPVFANILLADEINRSPAKVQSALLEAMQERQVTIGNYSYALPHPFLVLATQNPIDQEGTYPLPEAQIDRFMMKIFVHYPTRDEEVKILHLMAKTEKTKSVQPVLSAQDVLTIRQLVDKIELSNRLEQYIVDLVMATRFPDQYKLLDLKKWIAYGASPRATIALCLAAKAYAFLEGRAQVLPQDVKSVAPDVLNHRIILSYEAEAESISTIDCVHKILAAVPI
jgi:MoxR-like ATPase